MNRHICSCGRKTRRADGVCYWCNLKKVRDGKITRTHCAYCRELLPQDRVLISPYHYECADRVKSISLVNNAKVAKAIRLGTLKKVSDLSCVDCGKQATHYEHRYYSKPMDVEPVCRSCNYKRGPAIDLPDFHSKKVGADETAM